MSDIREAIASIRSFVKGMDFEQFEKDDKTVYAVLAKFIVIGEAIRSLADNFSEEYPEIEWSKIIGMRNKIVHDYFSIDKEVIWKTIEKRLPELEGQIDRIVFE